MDRPDGAPGAILRCKTPGCGIHNSAGGDTCASLGPPVRPPAAGEAGDAQKKTITGGIDMNRSLADLSLHVLLFAGALMVATSAHAGDDGYKHGGK